MPAPHQLVFEAGFVRSLRYPKRFGNAQTIISTGRWPSGETITGSDAAVIARYLKPCLDKRGSKRVVA